MRWFAVGLKEPHRFCINTQLNIKTELGIKNKLSHCYKTQAFLKSIRPNNEGSRPLDTEDCQRAAQTWKKLNLRTHFG